MAKKLTNFLIALNDSIKLRDKSRDPQKRQKLLEQWDLEDEDALKEDAEAADITRRRGGGDRSEASGVVDPLRRGTG